MVVLVVALEAQAPASMRSTLMCTRPSCLLDTLQDAALATHILREYFSVGMRTARGLFFLRWRRRRLGGRGLR